MVGKAAGRGADLQVNTRLSPAGRFNNRRHLKENRMNTTATGIAAAAILSAGALAKLSEYDFILVIDKSGSMGEDDMGGRSRWDYMQETAVAFARDICKIDSDGIGLVVFGGKTVVAEDGCDVSKVKDVLGTLRPGGGTPLHLALAEALKLAGKSAKKDFIIVFTDGVQDDPAQAAEVIRSASNAQETDDALTILFVQVGYDAGATRYLKSLDDDLKGAKFDIVDAKTIDEAEKFPSTAELVLHAIQD
jgi:Mg-chelatase subunit ChlD